MSGQKQTARLLRPIHIYQLRGYEIPDDAIESLRTVGDVVNFVDSHAQN